MTRRTKGAHHLIAAGVACLIIIAVVYTFVPARNASVLPGFQGMTSGFYCYQSEGNTCSVYPTEIPASNGGNICSYAWNGVQTSSSLSVIGKTGCSLLSVSGSDTMYADFQTNLIACTTGSASPCPTFWSPIPISYTIKDPSDANLTEVVAGQINLYYANINLGINSGGNYLTGQGLVNFGGDAPWGIIVDETWDETQSGGANCNPNDASASNQCVFETPLYGVVNDFDAVSNWANNNCGLCLNGAAVPFYSSPSTDGTCNTLAGLFTSGCYLQGVPTGVNATLTSVYAPDSRMQKIVYFPIPIVRLENSCSVLGCSAPQGEIQMLVYTLQLGEYVTNSQNPNHQGVSPNPTQSCSQLVCDVDTISSWFSNPLNDALLVAVVVAIVVLVFAPGLIVALIGGAKTAKRRR